MDVFPDGVLHRAGAAELEEAVKRAQGQGDQSEKAPGIEADGEIDGLLTQVNRPVPGKRDRTGGRLEIPGAENAFLDIERAEGGLRALEPATG